jgi:hypothetical protein
MMTDDIKRLDRTTMTHVAFADPRYWELENNKTARKRGVVAEQAQRRVRILLTRSPQYRHQ